MISFKWLICLAIILLNLDVGFTYPIKPCYFEAQHPLTQRKFYFLGTYHRTPFSVLPKAIQRHVLSHKIVATEQNNPGERRSIYVRDYDIEKWKNHLYFRLRSDKKDHLGSLTPHQYSNFIKAVGAVYPYLVAGIDRVKLQDFGTIGLPKLYSECLNWLGMDDTISSHYQKKGPGHAYALDSETCDKIAEKDKINWMRNVVVPENKARRLRGEKVLTPYEKFLEDLEAGQTYYRYYRNGVDYKILDSDNVLYGLYEGLQDPRTFDRPILKTRNLHWLPQILCNFEADLIAVGGDHMWGEYGLLRLMQRKGYNIRRANADAKFPKLYLKALDKNGKPLLSNAEKKHLEAIKTKWKTLINQQKQKNKVITQNLKKQATIKTECAKKRFKTASSQQKQKALHNLKAVYKQVKQNLTKHQHATAKAMQTLQQKYKLTLHNAIWE